MSCESFEERLSNKNQYKKEGIEQKYSNFHNGNFADHEITNIYLSSQSNKVRTRRVFTFDF